MHGDPVRRARQGHVSLPAKRVKFKAAIADLVRRGAQAVILGCTGFGTLPEAGDSSVPLIGTTLGDARLRSRWPCRSQLRGGRAMSRVTAGAPDWYRAGGVRQLGYSATRRLEHDRRPLSDPLARRIHGNAVSLVGVQRASAWKSTSSTSAGS